MVANPEKGETPHLSGKGKWYLAYVGFAGMENSVAAALRFGLDREELLPDPSISSDPEEDLIRKARERWAEVARQPYEGWDGEKYPHSAKLVYEIPLD